MSITTLKDLRLSERIVARAQRAFMKIETKRAGALERLEAEQARHTALIDDYRNSGATSAGEVPHE